jgi:hypothetical protein
VTEPERRVERHGGTADGALRTTASVEGEDAQRLERLAGVSAKKPGELVADLSRDAGRSAATRKGARGVAVVALLLSLAEATADTPSTSATAASLGPAARSTAVSRSPSAARFAIRVAVDGNGLVTVVDLWSRDARPDPAPKETLI